MTASLGPDRRNVAHWQRGDVARQDRQRQEFPGTFPGNAGFNIMAMRNIIQSGKHAKLQITCGDELQTSNCKEVFIQCWMRSHFGSSVMSCHCLKSGVYSAIYVQK